MKVLISGLEVTGLEGDVLKLKLEYFANDKPDDDILLLKLADPELMYASLILELDKIVTQKTGVKLKALSQKKVVSFFRNVVEEYEGSGKVSGRIEFKVG